MDDLYVLHNDESALTVQKFDHKIYSHVFFTCKMYMYYSSNSRLKFVMERYFHLYCIIYVCTRYILFFLMRRKFVRSKFFKTI